MSIQERTRRSPLAVAAYLGLAACLLAIGPARAGCIPRAMSSARTAAQIAGGLVPAVYHPAATPRFLQVGYGEDEDGDAIVGLWEFRFSVPEDRSRSVPEDFGTVLWHADGTEATISGGRPPSIGDTCQGVWRRIGRNTYTLSHVAMGWDLGSYTGVAHFHFRITLDPSGNSYSGTFTRTIYQFNPADPFDESGPVPVWPSASGTVTAKRVKPD